MNEQLPTSNQQPQAEPITNNIPLNPKRNLLSKTTITVFLIIFVLILLSAGAYLFLNSNKQIACTSEAKLCPDGSSVGRTGPKCEFTACPTATSTPDPTADWRTYDNTKGSFSFKYPPEMKNFFSDLTNPEHLIRVSTIQEEIDKYDSFKSPPCPGDCQQLLDKDVLQKQFSLLTQVNNFLPTCNLTPSYTEDFKKNFILLNGAIEYKIKVEGINLDGTCGIKFIDYDSYDVNLSNFFYNIVFLNNNQITQISFSLFPRNSFTQVNRYYEQLGEKNGFCDITCSENEIGAYKSFSLNKEPVATIIKTYDKVFSTFKFTDQASKENNVQSPTQIVNNFYSKYINCQKKNMDAALANKPTPENCDTYKESSILSQTLITKIKNTQGFDLLLCAQNFPLNFKTDDAVISKNTATTTVHTYYGSADNPITVSLTSTANNTWKINGITCNH